MVSIPVAPVSSVLSSGFLHTEAGASGASVILSCRRLYVNHTGNQGNSWVRPPKPLPIGCLRGNPKSQVLADPQMGTESCGGITHWAERTVLDCSTCELPLSLSVARSLPLAPFFSLSLSLYDFRICCFILQLPSNRLASVSVSMCSRGGGRCGRESSSSPLSDSISFSVPLLKVLMDAEYVSSHLEHYHQQQPSVFLNLFHFG